MFAPPPLPGDTAQVDDAPLLASLPSLSKPRIPCPYCPLSFDRTFNLNRHVRATHPAQAGAPRLDCALCGEGFYNTAQLDKHARDCRGASAPPPSAPSPSSVVWSVPSSPSLSSSSSSSSPSPSPLPFEDDPLHTAAADFLLWLQQPALPTEHVKRRPATPKAALQAMTLLRGVVRDASAACPSLFANGLHLRALIAPEVVEGVVRQMSERDLQPGSIYPVALLLKKVAQWMCSRQSRLTRAFVSPDSLDAWGVIAQHCYSSTVDRKRQTRHKRNRGEGEDEWMRAEETQQLLGHCLTVFNDLMKRGRIEQDDARLYTDHLIVALLVIGMAPRVETFRAMTVAMVRPPGSDRRVPEQYVLDGEHGKTSMVYYMPIHPVLTKTMAFYLGSVLPPMYTGALFRQRGGGPRQDFSYVTRALTTQYLGRPINASKFRKSVVTDLLGRDGVKDHSVAELMGHSLQTQQEWYRGTMLAQQARVCQDAMLGGVAVPEGML